MFKDMAPQFVQGSKAWADGKNRSDNPYNPSKQPAFYGRWDNGWTDCDRLIHDEAYSDGHLWDNNECL